MNPFEMVVAIIIVVTIGQVLRARFGHPQGNSEITVGRGDGEIARMQDEILKLRERISVLERVITDTHSSSQLDREIEKLRDHNRV